METDDLKKRILDLEQALAAKSLEVLQYRQELVKTNAFLQQLIADLSQEVKMAGLIQKILSPTEIPNIPGIEFSTKFLPGGKAGGDYFDIFVHEDRLKFGIIVSSSSGYTISALFLSVLMKLSGQIEARKGMDPDKVITMMATEMVPHIQKNDSISLFYGVVDRRTYELKYSSIGSIAGILQIHGQDNPAWLEPSSGPLRQGYSENPLTDARTMGPRDRLILCTEGVLNTTSPEGEVFGKDRLLKSLSKSQRLGVHDIRNEILFQVEKFRGSAEPVRDQTVVVTEIKDRVIKLAKKSPV